VKKEASAQHPSQGGGTSRNRLLPEWLQKQVWSEETFIRAYPPAPNGYREYDLFNGAK
jgi:mycothiol S-conjugate amidase